ncbi:MAG TPA: hypothetical protein VMC09_06785 [Anaerolineales bacterium]|nr:hypothetical protein [Anaerolineales bacterium]
MSRRILIPALIALNILVIAYFIVQYTAASYPLVGHDFRLYIPRLIDSHLYYKVNGFGIEWYTPSFGGGLPAYPNPLQMQFSIPQLLTWFMNPWVAILASTVIYVAVGFLLMFFLLRDCLEFKPLTAVLGGVFFVANGFYVEHVVVGHVNFLTFPLIILPVFAFANRKLPNWLAGALIAITGAVLVNSGGVYIGVICAFTLLLSLPVIHLLKPGLMSWEKGLAVAAWGTILTLLLCGSKVYAINALMQSFPRDVQDVYHVSWISSLEGVVMQLVGSMTVLPLLKLIGKSSLDYVVRLTNWTGSPYGFWELDISLSPLLTFLLLWGLGRLFFRKPKFNKKEVIHKIIAGIILLFSIVLVIQFATARGFLFDHLDHLPILKSMRTNSRFIAAFILPLAILGSRVFDGWMNSLPGRKSAILFTAFNVISVAALATYYLLPIKVQERTFDTQELLKAYDQIQAGQVFPVNKIIPDANDYEVFVAQASNTTHHYDPLYGENSFLPKVHEGSVFDVQNGFYNMTDPTGYVYPQVNNSKLFSLIPVSDKAKLIDFLNRRKSDWKLPFIQIILDWAAGVTFVVLLLAILLYSLRKWIPVRFLAVPPFAGSKRA